MRYLKTFENFADENIDFYLDVCEQFIKIVKIHEQYFYNDIKISTDKEFVKEIHRLFNMIKKWKISIKVALPEELCDIIIKKEKEHYDDDKMKIQDNDYDSSLMEVCFGIEEDVSDKFDKDECQYFWNFSKKDVYLEKGEIDMGDSDWSVDEITKRMEEENKKELREYFRKIRIDFGLDPNISDEELDKWIEEQMRKEKEELKYDNDDDELDYIEKLIRGKQPKHHIEEENKEDEKHDDELYDRMEDEMNKKMDEYDEDDPEKRAKYAIKLYKGYLKQAKTSIMREIIQDRIDDYESGLF
jgi:hypothetical protein